MAAAAQRLFKQHLTFDARGFRAFPVGSERESHISVYRPAGSGRRG